MVVHLFVAHDEDTPPQVGLVVSKAVGNAVRRNLVKRRLRSAARGHLAALPCGARAVVRALPASAHAEYSQLERDVATGFSRAVERSLSAGDRTVDGGRSR